MYRSPYEASAQWPAITRQLRRNTIRSLAEVVSRASGLPLFDIIGPSHGASCAKARHIAAWLARRFTSCSLPLIAKHIRRNHSTILYAVARVNLAIKEADIAAPAADTPEAWAVILWVTPWPALNYRDPMRLRP